MRDSGQLGYHPSSLGSLQQTWMHSPLLFGDTTKIIQTSYSRCKSDQGPSFSSSSASDVACGIPCPTPSVLDVGGSLSVPPTASGVGFTLEDHMLLRLVYVQQKALQVQMEALLALLLPCPSPLQHNGMNIPPTSVSFPLSPSHTPSQERTERKTSESTDGNTHASTCFPLFKGNEGMWTEQKKKTRHTVDSTPKENMEDPQCNGLDPSGMPSTTHHDPTTMKKKKDRCHRLSNEMPTRPSRMVREDTSENTPTTCVASTSLSSGTAKESPIAASPSPSATASPPVSLQEAPTTPVKPHPTSSPVKSITEGGTPTAFPSPLPASASPHGAPPSEGLPLPSSLSWRGHPQGETALPRSAVVPPDDTAWMTVEDHPRETNRAPTREGSCVGTEGGASSPWGGINPLVGASVSRSSSCASSSPRSREHAVGWSCSVRSFPSPIRTSVSRCASLKDSFSSSSTPSELQRKGEGVLALPHHQIEEKGEETQQEGAGQAAWTSSSNLTSITGGLGTKNASTAFSSSSAPAYPEPARRVVLDYRKLLHHPGTGVGASSVSSTHVVPVEENPRRERMKGKLNPTTILCDTTPALPTGQHHASPPKEKQKFVTDGLHHLDMNTTHDNNNDHNSGVTKEELAGWEKDRRGNLHEIIDTLNGDSLHDDDISFDTLEYLKVNGLLKH